MRLSNKSENCGHASIRIAIKLLTSALNCTWMSSIRGLAISIFDASGDTA
jgi:hypothetical protein